MIGKRIGKTIYIHKNYITSLDETNKNMLKGIEYEFQDLFEGLMKKCSILKFEKDTVTFLECINFDSSLNPTIKKWYKFSYEKHKWIYKGIKTNSAVNPLILHKKELMVGEDYKGFSVELARKWDEMLFKSNIDDFLDKTKIGRLKYWKSCLAKFVNNNNKIYNDFITEWEKQFV